MRSARPSTSGWRAVYADQMNLSDSAIERFLSKVGHYNSDECWLWTGNMNEHGYGRFSIRHRWHYAHVISYLIHYGEVPEGLEVDHRCRNRSCVNFRHLEAVTHAVNMRRSAIARFQAGSIDDTQEDKCVNGHELTENNVIAKKRHGTNCRTCSNESRREARKRKKEQAAMNNNDLHEHKENQCD